MLFMLSRGANAKQSRIQQGDEGRGQTTVQFQSYAWILQAQLQQSKRISHSANVVDLYPVCYFDQQANRSHPMLPELDTR